MASGLHLCAGFISELSLSFWHNAQGHRILESDRGSMKNMLWKEQVHGIKYS